MAGYSAQCSDIMRYGLNTGSSSMLKHSIQSWEKLWWVPETNKAFGQGSCEYQVLTTYIEDRKKSFRSKWDKISRENDWKHKNGQLCTLYASYLSSTRNLKALFLVFKYIKKFRYDLGTNDHKYLYVKIQTENNQKIALQFHIHHC